MLEEMIRAVVRKLLAADYPHLKLPAVLFARVESAAALEEYDVGELVIHNSESGGSYQGHITARWYKYSLTILDRFGDPDDKYPPLPDVKSKKQFRVGAVVAVALPYGELTPAIIGEVRL